MTDCNRASRARRVKGTFVGLGTPCIAMGACPRQEVACVISRGLPGIAILRKIRANFAASFDGSIHSRDSAIARANVTPIVYSGELSRIVPRVRQDHSPPGLSLARDTTEENDN